MKKLFTAALLIACQSGTIGNENPVRENEPPCVLWQTIPSDCGLDVMWTVALDTPVVTCQPEHKVCIQRESK